MTIASRFDFLKAAAGQAAYQNAVDEATEHENRIATLESAVAGGGVPSGAMVFNVVTQYGAVGDGVTYCNTAFTNAVAAAKTWVTNNTGRRAVIYVPAGKYAFNRPGISRYAIDMSLSTHTGITFLGDGDGRSILYKADDSLGGEFDLICVSNNSSDIEFRHLTFDGGGETNPDQARQNHLINLLGPVSDCRAIDCTFQNCIGDGWRQIGNPGAWVTNMRVYRCRFLSCARSGTEFQRFVRYSVFSDCFFTGGTDQMIDFEPTGYTLKPATASTATTLVCDGSGVSDTAQFISWGVYVGMPIRANNLNETAYVVSVDSQTQLTTTALKTGTWAPASCGTMYFFSVLYAQFNNCVLYNSDSSRIIWTLSGSYGTRIQNCRVYGGNIQGNQVHELRANGLTIVTGNVGADPNNAIGIIGDSDNISLQDVHIVCRAPTTDTVRGAVKISYANGVRPAGVKIRNMFIRAECRQSPAVDFEGVKDIDVDGLKIIKADSGNTDVDPCVTVQTAGGFGSDSVRIRGFSTVAEQGRWLVACQVNVGAGLSVGSVDIEANVTSTDTKYALAFNDTAGAGTFSAPPRVAGSLAGSTGIFQTLPLVPWVRTDSAQGLAAQFVGTGSPNGVLSAPQGSVAQRTDGGAGTTLYVRETGAATNWTAK